MRAEHVSTSPRRGTLAAFWAIGFGLLASSSIAMAQPTEDDVRAQLLDTEYRSEQLARQVSVHLDEARVTRRQSRAQCFDVLLSQVHALGREAGWRALQVGRDSLERQVTLSRQLRRRLAYLRRHTRRCLGSAQSGTEVSVEVASWVPRGAPERVSPRRARTGLPGW
ncbi:MAG: hypothetical protein AAGE52_25605 [Myxococcota bacterium]